MRENNFFVEDPGGPDAFVKQIANQTPLLQILNGEGSQPDTSSGSQKSEFQVPGFIVLTPDKFALIATELKVQKLVEENDDLRRQLKEADKAAEELASLSQINGLSNLYNKEAFATLLQAAIAEAESQSVSLVLLDIDAANFKIINDRHGHAIGDEVIRIIASVLTKTVRVQSDSDRPRIAHDTVSFIVGDTDQDELPPADVGHLNGDHFSVILLGSNEAQSQQIIERIKNSFRESIGSEYDFEEIKVALSIGSAAYTSGMSAAELASLAEQSMYADKAANAATNGINKRD